MNEQPVELGTLLAEVRRRWQRKALLRAWTLGTATAAAIFLIGAFAVWFVAGDGIPLVIAVAAVLASAAVALVCALLPLRQSPADLQLARFIEERSGGLDDVLVTAVQHSAGPSPGDARGISALLAADAARAARGLDLDTVISHRAISHSVLGASLASLVFLAAAVWFAPSAGRASKVAAAYLFPSYYRITVSPGDAKVHQGQPLRIVARMPGIEGLKPILTVGKGADARTAELLAGDTPGEFVMTLKNLTVSFPYHVSAGSTTSPEFNVTVVRPIRVSRVDLRFEYPKGLGLAPRNEEDGGDIYAPEGTKVEVTVTTDKPVAQAQLALADGGTIPLTGPDRVLTAELTVNAEGSYRIALEDLDGFKNAGDTEYFIRTVNDSPPDVRILRPAGDRHVSPLEEVTIEAHAEDDYGVGSLELVLKASNGRESVVPLAKGGGLSVNGSHTLFLEDLNVQPGDFVTYHARARDVAHGRQSAEARSDIYFLEVKPYEEEFVSAESQAMGGMMGQQTDVDTLAAAQKDIIAATWKLDARARKTQDAKSAQDIRAVAEAQTSLKAKTEELSGQIARATADPRRRRLRQPGAAPSREDAMTSAIEAMGRAAQQLDRLRTSEALPFEMDALNQLLKVAAEIRRLQVSRQQAMGGGSGNRQTPDLSTLFDQELRKQQQTNYETPSSTEQKAETKKADDPLDKIRDLARRQEALNKEQRDLAKDRERLNEDELKRMLEKLTREQNDLRQQAEELSRQMQRSPSQQGQNSQSAQGAQGAQGSSSQSGKSGQSGESQKMRDVSEEMRNASSDLRRQDPEQASSRGDRALQQLRRLEEQLQGSRPDERKRALGDLQLEARQLADAQRRIGNEASRTAGGAPGEDARRRLAGDQERLADRTDRLGDAVRQLGQSGTDVEPQERQATSEASRQLDQQQVAGRMRESAQAMRQDAAAQNGSRAGQSEDLARALDKVAEQLGAATGTRDAESQRLSSQIARTQELRDRLAELQQSMDSLARASDAAQRDANGQQSPAGAREGTPSPGQNPAQPGASGRQGTSGQQGSSAGGSGGDVARLQRDVEEQMREAQRMTEDLRRQNPGMQKGGSTPEDWQRSVSAPGTEGFKQDFAKWESLKKNLMLALEQTESKLSDQLRAREKVDRLNVGRYESAPESYRELVDRYYQSLATPRRVPR
jgi:Domain of unknown function (DUF4175)